MSLLHPNSNPLAVFVPYNINAIFLLQQFATQIPEKNFFSYDFPPKICICQKIYVPLQPYIKYYYGNYL